MKLKQSMHELTMLDYLITNGYEERILKDDGKHYDFNKVYDIATKELGYTPYADGDDYLTVVFRKIELPEEVHA